MGCLNEKIEIKVNAKEENKEAQKGVAFKEEKKIKILKEANSKEIKEYKYSDPKDKINLEEIENLSLNKVGIVNNIQELINELKLLSKDMNEESKAYLVYCWICQNIEYDTFNFFSNNISNSKTSPEDCFKNKKAISVGYSNLFSNIGSNLGLEIISISGYCKGYGYFQGQIFNNINHSWNAIKINSNWHLLDSCWGAGYVTKDKIFIREFIRYHFCMNPYVFLLRHLPSDSQYQLIANPISLKDYEKRVSPLRGFYINDFYEITELNYEFEVQDNMKTLSFKSKKDVDKNLISIKFYYLQNNEWIIVPKNEYCSFSEKNEIDVFLVFNKKGEYKIKILIGEGNNKGHFTGHHLIEYKAICQKDSDLHLSLLNEKIKGKTNYFSKQILKKEEIEAFGCINLSNKNWYNMVQNNIFILTFYINKNDVIKLGVNFYILNEKQENWQKLERDNFKIEYYEDKIDLYLIFNNKGHYKLETFLNGNYYNRFWFGCQNDKENELKYPLSFKGSEIINIIKPEYNNLKDQENIAFKIYSKSLNTINIYNNKHYTFHKNSKGFFEFELKVNKGDLLISNDKFNLYKFQIN